MHDWERLQQRDPDAFAALVAAFQQRVISTCYRFTHNLTDAEDIAQEVFFEVYRSLDTFRGEAALSTWIYRLAVSKSLDLLRKMKRKKRFAVRYSLFGLEEQGIVMPAPDHTRPEAQLEAAEQRAALHRAMAALPENQRIALVLTKLEAFSYPETAGIMRTSVSAIESLIFRAMKNLRATLTDYYEKNL